MKKNNSRVVNLGCRLNYFESEVIDNILSKNKISDKIVVNTCSVTNQAVKKSISEIKKAKRNFPNHEIIVTGCASQVERPVFLRMKEVSEIIDNNLKTCEDSYLLEKKNVIKKYNFPSLPNGFKNRTRASLQIQQGCNHRCTFCIIPFGRGDSISMPVGEISSRLKNFIVLGYKEIILTGIDLTSYGGDLPGKPKLGNVIKRLLDLHPRLTRLRLSSIDPAEMDEDLIDLFKHEKRLMPHLHLSLQSGDNLILKRMKRRHTRELIFNICHEIKLSRKDITFGADVIVGFPTETEINFSNTTDLIKICKFSNLHIFPFSPKLGTPAARMPQVDNRVKYRRVQNLKKVSKDILLDLMANKIGKTVDILFESTKKSYTNDFFKVSMVDGNKKNILDFKNKIGKILRVKIKSQNQDFLKAEF